MKKRISLFAGVLCLSFTLMTGCKKHDCAPCTVDGCRIEKIIPVTPTYGDSAVFTYNQSGDPVSMTTSNENLVFKYDGHNRLTEVGDYYNNGFYQYWHHYIYNHQNVIVADSLYDSGPLLNGVPASHFYIHYVTFNYDAQGRIIQKRDSASNGGPFNPIVINYVYDSKGNLENGASYDDKISLRRTNKIWEFIDQNYSLNNEIPAGPYNNAGLPLRVAGNPQFFGFLHFGAVNVTYSCKACEVNEKSSPVLAK